MDKPTEKKSELLEALRNKIKNTLDEPLTANSFLKILRMAKMGREIIILEANTPGNVIPGISPDIMSDIGLDGIGGPGMATPMAMGGFYQGAENYGANVMRELVSLANKWIEGKDKATPAEIVQAIVIAKEHNQLELADKLEKSLLSSTNIKSEDEKKEKVVQ